MKFLINPSPSDLRQFCFLVPIFLLASCLSKNKDESKTERDEEIDLRSQFEQAEACGNRYNCAALDKLQERAEQPGEVKVLRAAFDIMCDPHTQTFERLFKMASATARAWAAARTTQGHHLTIEEEKELRANVMRLLKRKDNVIPGHTFVEYLSDAKEIFEREALDTARGNEEVHSAMRGLQTWEKDLTTLKKWLTSQEERPQIAGALLLNYFNHDFTTNEEEISMLLQFAQRKSLYLDAVEIIAEHAMGHEDPAFDPVIYALKHHPDPAIRKLSVFSQEKK